MGESFKVTQRFARLRVSCVLLESEWSLVLVLLEKTLQDMRII